MGDLKIVKIYFECVFKIYLGIFDFEDLKIVFLYNNMGVLFCIIGDLVKVEECYIKVLVNCCKNFGDDSL